MEALGNEGISGANSRGESLTDLTLHGELLDALAQGDLCSNETRMQQIKSVFEPSYVSAKVCAVIRM